MNNLFPNNFPRKGEIYKFNFNPTKGKEIRDIHPGLVISNNIQNEYGHYIIVAPVTSSVNKFRLFEVPIDTTSQTGLTKPGKILLNQIRSLDKNNRFISYSGSIDKSLMKQVNSSFKFSS
jgi:mRNA interferase MazF